ncbi:hypothetical protein C8J56DRAFT_134467 [Mycena floridula]|nr:hypothetical protein C8J56DRAFT_134467 [Mycena floridula]
MLPSTAIFLIALVLGSAAAPIADENWQTRRSLESRANEGDCSGPSSTTTGGDCEKIAGGATGFTIDGKCISTKLAAGSVYKHKSGTCHKRINRRRRSLESRANEGDCSGPSSTTTGGDCEKIAGGATGFTIDGKCISIKLAAGSVYKHKSGTCHKRINRRSMELEDDM